MHLIESCMVWWRYDEDRCFTAIHPSNHYFNRRRVSPHCCKYLFENVSTLSVNSNILSTWIRMSLTLTKAYNIFPLFRKLVKTVIVSHRFFWGGDFCHFTLLIWWSASEEQVRAAAQQQTFVQRAKKPETTQCRARHTPAQIYQQSPVVGVTVACWKILTTIIHTCANCSSSCGYCHLSLYWLIWTNLQQAQGKDVLEVDEKPITTKQVHFKFSTFCPRASCITSLQSFANAHARIQRPEWEPAAVPHCRDVTWTVQDKI